MQPQIINQWSTSMRQLGTAPALDLLKLAPQMTLQNCWSLLGESERIYFRAVRKKSEKKNMVFDHESWGLNTPKKGDPANNGWLRLHINPTEKQYWRGHRPGVEWVESTGSVLSHGDDPFPCHESRVAWWVSLLWCDTNKVGWLTQPPANHQSTVVCSTVGFPVHWFHEWNPQWKKSAKADFKPLNSSTGGWMQPLIFSMAKQLGWRNLKRSLRRKRFSSSREHNANPRSLGGGRGALPIQKELKHIGGYWVYHGLPCSSQPKWKFTPRMLISPHSMNQEPWTMTKKAIRLTPNRRPGSLLDLTFFSVLAPQFPW